MTSSKCDISIKVDVIKFSDVKYLLGSSVKVKLITRWQIKSVSQVELRYIPNDVN